MKWPWWAPWAAGGAAVVALGVVAWIVANPMPPPAGTQVTTLTKGTGYHVAATVAKDITSATALLSALAAGGWTDVTIEGQSPSGINPGSSYQVYGVWSGASGTPVPSGVTVTTAPYGPNAVLA